MRHCDFGGYILQRQHSIHFHRPVTHPYGGPAIPSCSPGVSVAHALPADRQMLHLLLLQVPQKPALSTEACIKTEHITACYFPELRL